jgi:hypothetical protein
MTTEKQTGGAAFPSPIHPECSDAKGMNFGMTLRQWYAGQALVGLMADPSTQCGNDAAADNVAATCLRMADALIRQARSKDKG